MLKKIIAAVVLASLSCSVNSEFKTNKDWYWDTTPLPGDIFYAGTVNQDNRILGQYCQVEGSCYYMVNLGTTCEKGSRYPAIINSNTGASTINLVCSHSTDDGQVFIVTPYDDVNDIILKGNSVGFAVAMKDGAFKVVRFSLAGSSLAIDKMIERALEFRAKNTKSDEYLL